MKVKVVFYVQISVLVTDPWLPGI